jgi:hypothetical protein
MTETLDRLLHDASPITDDEVRALPLDQLEEELCLAIVALGPASRPDFRRRPLRWRFPALAAAAAAVAAVLLVSLTAGGEKLGTSADRAWAASAVRVANAVPRLLVGEPGWTVTRADQFTVDEGEMTFRDGTRGVDLHWHSGASEDWLSDRRSEEELPPVSVLGTTARLFRYRGAHDDFTALWRSGGYTMELRTSNPPRLSLEEYRRVLGSLHAVGVDDWLAAMPPSVVLPAETDRVIDAMLAGIPLPDGFDKRELERHAVVRDRYQLGAGVTGAVACGWIEQWVTAQRTGDAAASAAAVEAMQSSRHWPILREMQTKGDYPEVLWGLADAIERDTAIRAGNTTTIEQGRSALGC